MTIARTVIAGAAIAGIAGMAGCGGAEPAGPRTAGPSEQSGPSSRGGSSVLVLTSPGTFVWLEPTFEHEFPPAEHAAYMDQQGQMFMPDSVVARTGQPFHFRSSEDVLHNVRVISNEKKPIFNVATPPFGSYTHVFDEPGVYNVTCDIHTAMRGTIFVSSTPYVGTADEAGRVTFEHVVPGTYHASGFADGVPVEKTVDVAGARAEVHLLQ